MTTCTCSSSTCSNLSPVCCPEPADVTVEEFTLELGSLIVEWNPNSGVLRMYVEDDDGAVVVSAFRFRVHFVDTDASAAVDMDAAVSIAYPTTPGWGSAEVISDPDTGYADVIVQHTGLSQNWFAIVELGGLPLVASDRITLGT